MDIYQASIMPQACARHTICMCSCSVILLLLRVSLPILSTGHLPFLDLFPVFESQVEKGESSSSLDFDVIYHFTSILFIPFT